MKILPFFKVKLSVFMVCIVMILGLSNVAGVVSAEEPMIVLTADDLDNIRKDLKGNYQLGADIDISDREWIPIDNFSGSLDGKGFVINGLTINHEETRRFNALFGQTNNAVITNVGLENVDILATNYTAALVGYMTGGKVENSYATGYIEGRAEVGGLVGQVRKGAIISNSYADVYVIGSDKYGGLVARVDEGSIIHSYSVGKVTGQEKRVGGLVGEATTEWNIVNSYWDTDTSGMVTSAGGGEGLSTTAMKKKASFVNWDFENIWYIDEGKDYPKLRLFQDDTGIAQSNETSVREEIKYDVDTTGFTDIKGHWAEQSIVTAVAKSIVNGYPDKTFKPEEVVTRAQFAVMLDRAFALEASASGKVFSDQEQIPDWAAGEIDRAVACEIISGYEDGSFRPNSTVTRTEMVIMVARAMELSIEDGKSTSYTDDRDIPDWAKGVIAAAQKKNLIVFGDGRNFLPKAQGTRAEAAAILIQAINE